MAFAGFGCHTDNGNGDGHGERALDPPGGISDPFGQWTLTDLDVTSDETFYCVDVVVDGQFVVNVLSAPSYGAPAIWSNATGVWTKTPTAEVNLVWPTGFRLSDDGALHILGQSADDEDLLVYLTNRTGEWIAETVDGEGRCYNNALALASEGSPRAAFSPEFVEGSIREIYLAVRTEDGWVTEKLPVESAAVVKGLEVDGQGHSFVHYGWDGDLFGSFILTDRLGQWGKITIFAPPEPTAWPDVIVIDYEERVHLAASEHINYGFAARIWATVEPFSFGDGSIVDEFADGPWMLNDIDLAVDHNLASHLVYGDWSLRYATNRWPSADWRINQIHDGDIKTLAVAVDANQNAHIAFSTPTGVKYATNRPVE
jgi:hypothetical protein